jgi:parallel beta-helix repeat protein
MCKKSNDWTIEYNNMSNNGLFGLKMQASDNTLRYNTILNNGWYGIWIVTEDSPVPSHGTNNDVFNNTLCGNSFGDIKVSNGDGSNTADSNTCDVSNIGGCDWSCGTDNANLVSVYFDFDNDGYYSDDSADCSCTNPAGGKCACCNPGLFDGSADAKASYETSCDCQWTPGLDPNDCDPSVPAEEPYYCDSDSDTYYSATPSGYATEPPQGCQLTPGDDCDDTNAAVNPGATEICNGIDDNCDGQIDEGVKTTFYRDADGDGYGNPADTTEACTAPTGYVSDNTDCDDGNADVNPGATEVCDDGIDNDCDNLVDDADPDCPPCPKPDLEITDIWTELKRVGRNVNTTIIWYNITNNGDTTAGRTYSNLTVDDGAQPRNDRVGKLTPGQTRTEKFTYKGDPHNITVCADCRCVVTESNETNNCLSVTV